MFWAKHRLTFALLVSAAAFWNSAAAADYRMTRDHGGSIERYKARYAAIRDRGERVIIDGVCNSACTLVLGIVPLNRVCVTRGSTALLETSSGGDAVRPHPRYM